MDRRIPPASLRSMTEHFSFAGMTEGDETRRTTCIGCQLTRSLCTITWDLEEDTETAQPGNAATSNFETKRS